MVVSVIYLLFAVIVWIILSIVAGPQSISAVGPGVQSDPISVIGQVLFNFTLANTVPSWVNTKVCPLLIDIKF